MGNLTHCAVIGAALCSALCSPLCSLLCSEKSLTVQPTVQLEIAPTICKYVSWPAPKSDPALILRGLSVVSVGAVVSGRSIRNNRSPVSLYGFMDSSELFSDTNKAFKRRGEKSE